MTPSNPEKVVKEVVDKLEHYESKFSQFIDERETHIKMYKGTPFIESKRGDMEGMAATRAGTTQEAVEALVNALFAMLTANDPNFEPAALRNDIPQDQIYKITQLLRFQLFQTKYKRKLMVALRSLVLNGSVFIEEPWVSYPGGKNPIWEATDFIPRPLYQVFFAPTATYLDNPDFMGTLDIISPHKLRSLSLMDDAQKAWLKDGIDAALAKDTEAISSNIKNRLTSMGYTDFKNTMELITYHGPLESENIYEDMDVGIVNREFLVKYYPTPGLRPIRVVHHIEIEGETLGYGVGHQLKDLQRWINSNRNRVMDVITFALYSMFFYNKFTGLKMRDLKIRPWSFHEVDDVNGIKPITPDLNAANYGLRLEELLQAEARNITGASPQLQAMITEATASEVRIAQSNSIRRVANEAEIIADELIRNHLIVMHKNNWQYLDRPIWVRASGMTGPERIFPNEIQHDLDFFPKIVTDKDFAPAMIKNSLQVLQILTSIRNIPPKGINVDMLLSNLIMELVRRLGIDPSPALMPQEQTPEQATPERVQAMLGLLNRERAMAGPASPQESMSESLGAINGMGGQ